MGELPPYVCPIATPMADGKLVDKLFKLVKKAAKGKCLKRGVKEVVKALRKKEKGICLIAGDVSPMDVITHIPALCEENDIAYIYVPSKHALGAASCTKRPTSCVLISPAKDWEHREKFDKAEKAVKSKQPSL